MTGQNITPHLWFDKEAKEAAEFYCSIFPDSKITSSSTIHGTPSGDSDIVSFQLWGHSFMAISAGPAFTFNPSTSLFVNFGAPHLGEIAAREQIDIVWEKLSEGGTVLMPLEKYPFSERYGWIQDKYGLSWQLILSGGDGDPRPPIMPSLLFVGDKAGKAEEAMDFYMSVFSSSEQGTVARYPKDSEPDKEGTIMFADFKIRGEWLTAMDSAHEHGFTFSEAISFIVRCADQKEIDYFWDELSAVPEAEQCGWLKDKYGVSWQIVPKDMEDMMQNGTTEQIDRVTQAFLAMKKFDIATLRKAYEGK